MTILHVDMDAFYASVLLRDRPDLAEVPVIVGAGHRGVVLAANYPARRFGVSSGMPSGRARRLCPQAVILTPDYDQFSSVSRSVMAVFARITPHVQAMSMDEAFLDVSGSTRLFGSAVDIAEHIRAVVHDEQRITCSVGIADTMSVAKVASARAKPDGVLEVPADRVTSFLHPLDVGDLYGVGEKTRAALHRLGLTTVGSVAHTPRQTLQRALGHHAGGHVHDLAWGIDQQRVEVGAVGAFGYGGSAASGASASGLATAEKSMGSQETFGHDIDDRDVIVGELLRLAGSVTGRVRAAELAGRTVTITVRFADFTTITRSRTLREPTDVTQEIYRAAVGLYDALGLQRVRIRLVGVRVENLVPRGQVHRQLTLGEPEHGWSDADRAMDRARLRFGSDAVGPATLLGSSSRGVRIA